MQGLNAPVLGRRVVRRHFSSTVHLAQLDQAIATALKCVPVPGLSLVVMKKGEPTFTNMGIARLDEADYLRSTPMDSKSLFHLGGSIQKHFLAVVAAQLHAEGQLNLDEPISNSLPGLKFTGEQSNAKSVTARHLLTHTSGIKEFRNTGDIAAAIGARMSAFVGPVDRPSLDEYYLGSTCGTFRDASIHLVNSPGAQHIKSHHNYGLTALLVRRATGGQSLRDTLRERVFGPLGMTHTDIALPDGMRANLVEVFTRKRDGLHKVKTGKWDASAGRPIEVGGGLYTTPDDLSRYLAALSSPALSNGVISESILDELLRPVYNRDPFLPSQALSFSTESVTLSGGPSSVAYVTDGQGMGWGGAQAVLAFCREHGVAVAAFCNTGSNSYEMSTVTAAALSDALKAVGGGEPSKAKAPAVGQASLPATNSPKEAMGMTLEGFEAATLWPKICGVYRLPRHHLSARALWTLGGEVQVYLQDGRLRIRALWGPLRTQLFGKGQGLVLSSASDCHPLHYVVTGASRSVLSTPVRGTTDIAFDVNTGEMHIGLMTLKKAPAWQSLRYWGMAILAYNAFTLIGKGKALDIISGLIVFS